MLVLEAEFNGSAGLSTCVKRDNTRSVPGKQDPLFFFKDVRSHWVRFNRMSPNNPVSAIVISSIAMCAIKDNLYSTSMILQLDKDVDLNELETRIMNYYNEQILHMEVHQQLDPKIFMTIDTSSALNSTFAVCVSHHPCPSCSSRYVYHLFRDCPVLAHAIRSGYAF